MRTNEGNAASEEPERAIALVAFDLSPTRGTESGTAHQWLRILARLYRCEVYVHESHRGEIESFPYGKHVRFHYVPVPRRISRFFERLGLHMVAHWFFVRSCRPMLYSGQESGDFELVHFITPAGFWSFNTIYRGLRIPYIVGPLGGALRTPSGFLPVFGVPGSMIALVRDSAFWLTRLFGFHRSYLSHAASIVVSTESQIGLVPAALRSRTHILFDTIVDMEEFSEKVFSPGQMMVQVIFCGRLVRLKGGRMLIDAIRMLKSAQPDLVSRLTVLMVGDGNQRTTLEKRAADAGLAGGVRFLGRVPRKEMLRLLRESDIFCLPTIRESGGTAILEAMATGLPIITSNYGGPGQSVTDECGVRIPVLDYKQYVRDLAAAIQRLASDYSLRKTLGTKARERVKQYFSTAAFEPKIRALYAESFSREQEFCNPSSPYAPTEGLNGTG